LKSESNRHGWPKVLASAKSSTVIQKVKGFMIGKPFNQASFALNIALGVMVGMLALHRLSRAPASSVGNIKPGKKTERVNSQKRSSDTPDLIQQPKWPLYGSIASASDRRRWMIDQLRAMGVPNDTLALVARVDFEVQWDSRFEDCKGDRDKLAAVQLAMSMSKDAEMRAALGDADFRRWDQKNMLWEAMSTEVDVTDAEGGAIYDAKKKLQQRLLDLEQARLKGTMDDAEVTDVQDKAYAEYFQQLKDTLGDERYAKSQQLDDGFAADRLRHELAGVNPNDAQFQELFKASREYDKAELGLDPSSPDYAAQSKALNDARDQQYRQVLGDSAFDALQKQQDPDSLK
jgi:hypothetical protein